jgi:hypothetical protein
LARVIGCHVIAKGNVAQATQIAPQIVKHGLLVNQSFLGTAAYAYYSSMVLKSEASKPMAVFETDDSMVIRVPIRIPQNPNYAIMKMIGQQFSYIKINVLGFLNLSGFPQYNGTVGWV